MQISTENKHFLTYIGKYLGVALIAGSVVHIGTLQNGFTRYVVLAIIGLVLMMVGNILEAKQNGQKINLNYLLIITGLSFATGFLSGGIQHYLDNPIYAGWLLSIGIFVSYLTYFWKDKLVLKPRNIAIVFIFSVALLLLSNFVIKDLAFGLHTTLEGENTPKHHN
jgi:predicted PurR-regulated permease PerM